MTLLRYSLPCCLFLLFSIEASPARAADHLPGTEPLTTEGDLASAMVDGIDRFLLNEIQESVEARSKYWEVDRSSAKAFQTSIAKRKERLAHILGLREPRVPFEGPELVGTTSTPALVARSDGYDVWAVRWPAFRDVHGEGLLLVPTEGSPLGDIVAIPDADQTPEQLAGLAAGIPEKSQYARRLAESGFRVVVPSLISRKMQRRAAPGRQGGANLTHREFVHRSAFELGRHLLGYELQKVLACVDWYSSEKKNARIGVIGYGEGGLLALYAAALDTRIRAACVSGYFGPREGVWNEPVERNVFGLLEQFGDAEVAAMIAPRALVVESAKGPAVQLPSEGGAPAELGWFTQEQIESERRRALAILGDLPASANGRRLAHSRFLIDSEVQDEFGSTDTLLRFASQLSNKAVIKTARAELEVLRKDLDTEARESRQIHELDRHNQWLLSESPYVRAEFMNKLDTSSVEKYEASLESYREFFRDEVVGRFEREMLPPKPRSRKSYDEEKWVGYEVVLDVFPDVYAYGILCLPKDLKDGEKRPVVVCQHGLEGRPQDIVTGDHRAYHDFASKLAERGFITFAPQNIYIFRDRFRTLQRKANPLKKTLFSIMVPQHQQIVNWLKTLPNVDSERIAFYGLSYGGKSAMRIPPLVTDYCLSICSADFNEWVWKNASSRARYSYVFTGEYEIFEWDLGSTFNYAEMAALIAPRPFMVERGHFDGVAPDETVAYEFAKVRHLYQARLGLMDHCEIEWFVGPHTINGKGTFDFLHKHLDWPQP